MELLKKILNKEKVFEIAQHQTKALNTFADLFNGEKQKLKFKYLFPIKSSGLNINDARKLGFKVSKNMWKNCSNVLKRNNGGRPKTLASVKKALNQHIESNSAVASNRYLKKLGTCVFYRNISIKASYENFKGKEMISYSGFYKHMQKKYKKPHRFTDLCEYCELNKVNYNFPNI